jgi:hypothetical protein
MKTFAATVLLALACGLASKQFSAGTPGVCLYKIIFDNATDTYVKVNKMVFTR